MKKIAAIALAGILALSQIACSTVITVTTLGALVATPQPLTRMPPTRRTRPLLTPWCSTAPIHRLDALNGYRNRALEG